MRQRQIWIVKDGKKKRSIIGKRRGFKMGWEGDENSIVSFTAPRHRPAQKDQAIIKYNIRGLMGFGKYVVSEKENTGSGDWSGCDRQPGPTMALIFGFSNGFRRSLRLMLSGRYFGFGRQEKFPKGVIRPSLLSF
ncbi:hypothetical protein Tco_0958431 [Tanacetum coccineum]